MPAAGRKIEPERIRRDRLVNLRMKKKEKDEYWAL